MPYEIKKQKGKYCVFNKETGENKGCSPTNEMAIKHMKAMYVNEHMENLTSVMLEDNGPVIVGIAATNIPHLPLPPMSVVEENGKQLVRVPFLRSGIFRHPNGKLIFNDQIFDKMLENHEAGKSHYGVSLNEKHKPGAALAWFDKNRGGFIKKEKDPEYGDLLVGYGNPTSERTLDLIKNQEYVFASVEFNPKHQSNLIAKLSSDELESISEETLLEELMEEKTISLEEYNSLTEKAAKAEELVKLQEGIMTNTSEMKKKMEEMMKKMAALEEENKALKAKNGGKDTKMEIELPEETKIELEDLHKEVKRLKQNALETQVNLVITKAENFRDANGRGHSPVLLEIARNAMLGNEVKAGDNVIKLESAKPADVADYFRKVFVHLLENVPGQVKLEGRTESTDERSVLERGEAFTQTDYKDFWVERV